MKNLTKRWTQSGLFFLTPGLFSRSSKRCRGGLLSSCAPFVQPVLNFLASEEKTVSFCVRNLSYWTAIERCSNNSSILQKGCSVCSNCCALSIVSNHFSNFPIIPFDFFIVVFPLTHCKFAVIYKKENSEKNDLNILISYTGKSLRS